MKVRILFFLFVLGFSLKSLGADLSEIRANFHRAVLDEDKIESFHSFMLEQDITDPVKKAYLATSEALKAKLYWNPFAKIAQVNKFASLINDAVLDDAMSVEIRFLRLSVEYHLPKMLNKSEHIEDDKTYIMDHLIDVSKVVFDKSFARYILFFMSENGICSNENIGKLREQLE